MSSTACSLHLTSACKTPVTASRRGGRAARPAAMASAAAKSTQLRAGPRGHTLALAVRGRSAMLGRSGVKPMAAASSDTFEVTLSTEEARKTILLGQFQIEKGFFDIYVSGVARDSAAGQAGIKPGQILRALSDPVSKGPEMWVLSTTERLRFVKDSIMTTRKPNVTFQLDCLPTITAGMVEAVEAQAAAEAEAAERLNAQKPTTEGMIMTDRPDLYSDKWSGDTYTGSKWNELTGLLAVGILVPVLGIIFALATQGTLWGVVSFY